LEVLRADRADVPPGLAIDAGLCGWTLARAYTCSGDGIVPAACLGGSGTSGEAIADFAEAYANQNERDHAAPQAAVKGRQNRGDHQI
jgi:hypothetical protein